MENALGLATYAVVVQQSPNLARPVSSLRPRHFFMHAICNADTEAEYVYANDSQIAGLLLQTNAIHQTSVGGPM